MSFESTAVAAPSYEESFVRLRLEEAPSCNLACSYCKGESKCINYMRSGKDFNVLSTEEALLGAYIAKSSGRCDIGLSVPGDSLAHDSTFVTLRAFRDYLPGVYPCISTNGVLLEEKLNELRDAGATSISVTINAISAGTSAKIYSRLNYSGQELTGVDAAEAIVQSQWAGIIKAKKSGFNVKLNTLWIPGVNDEELSQIAIRANMLNISQHRVIRPAEVLGKASQMIN